MPEVAKGKGGEILSVVGGYNNFWQIRQECILFCKDEPAVTIHTSVGDCHRNAILSYVAAVVLASSETEEAYIHDGCQNSCACFGDSWWTSYEHYLSSDRGCIKALLWDRYKNICPVFWECLLQ